MRRFGKKGKLDPRFVEPFFITEPVGKVVHHLDLPDQLARIHHVFHISMLRKYVKDDRKVLAPNVDTTGITVSADASYEVEPV